MILSSFVHDHPMKKKIQLNIEHNNYIPEKKLRIKSMRILLNFRESYINLQFSKLRQNYPFTYIVTIYLCS